MKRSCEIFVFMRNFCRWLLMWSVVMPGGPGCMSPKIVFGVAFITPKSNIAATNRR